MHQPAAGFLPDAATTVVTVRVARPHEMLAARLLLPGLSVDGLLAAAHVATAGHDGPIMGAAAAAVAPATRVLGRCLSEVGVALPYRGRGLEQRLWATLASDAAMAGGGIVTNDWSPEGAGPPAEGWRVVQQRFEHTALVSEMHDHVVGLFDRLVAHGRVPAGARAVSLRDADVEAVADEHLRHFPGDRRQLLSSLRGGPPDFFHTDFSVVTLLGDRLTGFLVGHFVPGESLFDVDWKAVAPAFRNGWSNLMLMHALAPRLCPARVRAVRFRALTHNDDTRRVIAHFGGAVTRTESRYGLDAAETAALAAATR